MSELQPFAVRGGDAGAPTFEELLGRAGREVARAALAAGIKQDAYERTWYGRKKHVGWYLQSIAATLTSTNELDSATWETDLYFDVAGERLTPDGRRISVQCKDTHVKWASTRNPGQDLLRETLSRGAEQTAVPVENPEAYQQQKDLLDVFAMEHGLNVSVQA